ncbi:ABC transporter permease [Planctobacterium marinum]|uniref:ABC transporter permease n=1 Tax=Planctobacterium marinum TaxID=1631968 RepID=A0AA48KQ57_9ALTE|nr:hypothetical protein MACH26_29170 [Planctobacterium marinum]
MNLLHDLKYAARLMLKNPGFSALTILVMTIGLSICMYNYSFIHGVMLKDLPFEKGDRMYVINTVQNGTEYNGGSVYVADYLVMKEQLQGLEMSGAYYYNNVNVSGTGRAVRYRSIVTEANVFDFTSVPAMTGRVLNDQDTIPGANPVAVISYDLWQNFYGAKSNVLDSKIDIDGHAHQVIGVMPAGYKFPDAADIWTPMQLQMSDVKRGEGPALEVFIIPDEDTPISQINAQLDNISQRLAQDFPETNSGRGAMAKTYRIATMGNGAMIIISVLLTAVGFILVLACTNVGNLLLVRANERAKETAVRVALGAPRWRLISQMMWESLLVCLISGVFSVLLAAWGLEISQGIMAGVYNGPLPFYWTFEIDSHILLMSLLIVLATAILSGLVPALKISNGDFNSWLKDGTRGAQGKKAGKASSILVTMEIALSCCLLTIAAIMAVGANIVTKADYGVDYQNKYYARIELAEMAYPEDGDILQFYRNFIEDMLAQPEIADASLAGNVPGRYTGFTGIFIEGMDAAKVSEYPRANATSMMPGMLEQLHVAPLAGRLFDASDNDRAQRVAVVTDTFAMQHYGSIENALDKRYRFASDDAKTWYTIIGVVPHMIFGQPYAGFKERPAVLTSALQDTQRYMAVIATPSGTLSASDLGPVVQRALFSQDQQMAVYRESTYAAEIKQNTAGMLFLADIFKLMALAAVALAASGIYGVMSNAIEQKTHEFGVRRALGATDESVVRLVMRKATMQLLIGALIGSPLAWLIGNQMVSQFATNSIWIDVMYGAMPLLIGVIVLISAWFPARKAVKFEPSAALRYE